MSRKPTSSFQDIDDHALSPQQQSRLIAHHMAEARVERSCVIYRALARIWSQRPHWHGIHTAPAEIACSVLGK